MPNPLVSVLGTPVDLTGLLNILTYAFFFAFIFYGQRIQFYITLNSIGQSLNRLNVMRNKARNETIEYFNKSGSASNDFTERIDRFLDYVTIMPESMDPNGVVGKIEHIARTTDERVRSEVKNLLGSADEIEVSVAQNLLEIASALNQIHKVVRHYYLSGKKTNSYLTLVQLQMNMPLILQAAEALVKATGSIKLAQPIGDSVGPLVASRFMTDAPKQPIAKDTVMGVTEHKGRTLYVVKAEGPAGYVGQPDVAIRRLREEMGVDFSAIIMVDAALKLEGEKSGEIAEGVGAAIGGIGVEKFRIEEVASKHKIPLYAVLIKESEVEAITTMSKEIAQASETAAAVVRRVVEDKTKEGDSVLIAGIGNTLGVGQ